jgi:hypothetical protein
MDFFNVLLILFITDPKRDIIKDDGKAQLGFVKPKKFQPSEYSGTKGEQFIGFYSENPNFFATSEHHKDHSAEVLRSMNGLQIMVRFLLNC